MDTRKVQLSAADLAIGYKTPLASGIDVTLPVSEVTALLGCNGIGKSTLLRTLTGEIPSLAGTVTIDGRELASYSRRQLAKMMAIVTTEHVQAGGLTVQELVSLGRHPFTGMLGKLYDDDLQAVRRAMKACRIDHKQDSYVAYLSDGERQKAMIARALAQDTPLIILDEPFSFLDVAARLELLALLKEIASDGKTVLFSSHDVGQALRMSDNIWLLTSEGRLVCGKPDDICRSGAIDALFSSEDVLFDRRISDFVLRP